MAPLIMALLYAGGCVTAYWLGRNEGKSALQAYKDGFDKALSILEEDDDETGNLR